VCDMRRIHVSSVSHACPTPPPSTYIYIYVYMHICIYVYYMHMYMYITFGWVAKVDKGFGQLVSVQGGREYKVLINL